MVFMDLLANIVESAAFFQTHTVSKPTNHNTLLSSRKRKISLGLLNFYNLSKHGPVSAMKRDGF